MEYSLELIKEIKEEILPLFKGAWDEVDYLRDYVDLDPDWEQILQLEKLGMFRTYVARNDGVIVGFVCVNVQPLLHSKAHYASQVDVAYIDPSHRGTFKNLLEVVESDLRDQGVKVFVFNLKSWDKTGEFMKKENYEHVENVYLKVIN